MQDDAQPIVQHYIRQWENFRSSSTVLSSICAYLNRNWIRQEADEGRIAVRAIYEVWFAFSKVICAIQSVSLTTFTLIQLALLKWYYAIFVPLNAALTDESLKLIEDARKGEQIDVGLVKAVIDSIGSFNRN